MKYGYARVSPGGKSESVDAQARQLTKAGCRKVFRDVHVSGAKTDRAQLRRVIETLEPGDVLMVTRLDRLARSTRDLLNTLAAITERKAGFRSLGDAWADTTTSHGRLMLTVLGGLAEFERDLIRTRTGEGRERAKARGVKLGRKPKLTVHQRQEAIKRRDVDGEPIRDIARSYNVHNSTISRLSAWEQRAAMAKQLGFGRKQSEAEVTASARQRRRSRSVSVRAPGGWKNHPAPAASALYDKGHSRQLEASHQWAGLTCTLLRRTNHKV
jgi:DNA invertase Pin-like site-specific DNA recombinase